MDPKDVTLYGSEWTLTATLANRTPVQQTAAGAGAGDGDGGGSAAAGGGGAAITVGVMFYEDTYLGLDRLSAFHEHIGCTDCNAFFESETRTGPWVQTAGGGRRSAYVNFTAPDPLCKLFKVDVAAAHDAAVISTGPGTYTPGGN